MNKTFFIFCLFLLTACDSSNQESTSSSAPEEKMLDSVVGFNLSEVAEGFYVHQGVHVEIDHEDHADIPNIGFIVGDECVAVIDTGGSLEIGEKLRDSIKNKTDKPICYVINTHVHFDHVLGNVVFKQDNPKYVGHVNLAEAIDQNRNFFVDTFGADLGENPTGDLIIGPDVLVEETMEIDLGNRKLLLTANPKAHTATDLTILDEKTNILWLGDLLFMERVPSLDGTLSGWFDLMKKLHDQEYAQVVPGHGPASAPWPAAMEPQQQYFKVLIDDARKAVADGVFLGDAVNTIAQSEKDNWLLFEHLNKRAASRAYREFEWE